MGIGELEAAQPAAGIGVRFERFFKGDIIQEFNRLSVSPIGGGAAMPQIQIVFPDELLGIPGQTKITLENLAQEAFLVRLYELGQLSSGRAAELLHVSRREFLDVLNRYNVSLFDDQADLEHEARCGR